MPNYHKTLPCFINNIGLRFQIVYFVKKHCENFAIICCIQISPINILNMCYFHEYVHFRLDLNEKLLIYCIYWLRNDQVQFNLIMGSSGTQPL